MGAFARLIGGRYRSRNDGSTGGGSSSRRRQARNRLRYFRKENLLEQR